MDAAPPPPKCISKVLIGTSATPDGDLPIGSELPLTMADEEPCKLRMVTMGGHGERDGFRIARGTFAGLVRGEHYEWRE